MDCAELEAMAGRQREAVAYYERILGLEDRVVLGPRCRADAVVQVRQLLALGRGGEGLPGGDSVGGGGLS